MSSSFVHFIPILTTLLAIPFSLEIYRRYRRFPDRLHLLWWAIGIATYGVGTATEAATTLLGWREPVFRAWYVSGALLGGAPLAQGTVYLLLSRRVAHALTALLLTYVARGHGGGLPVTDRLCRRRDASAVSGRVLGWQWVRMFSPVVNLYAVVFLIGGAVLSALRYSGDPSTRHRMWANVLIADRRHPAGHRRDRDAHGARGSVVRDRAGGDAVDVDRVSDEHSAGPGSRLQATGLQAS